MASPCACFIQYMSFIIKFAVVCCNLVQLNMPPIIIKRVRMLQADTSGTTALCRLVSSTDMDATESSQSVRPRINVHVLGDPQLRPSELRHLFHVCSIISKQQLFVTSLHHRILCRPACYGRIIGDPTPNPWPKELISSEGRLSCGGG